MKCKTVALCYLLFVTGTAIVLASLVAFPVRRTEAYVTKYSRICHDNRRFSIPSNDTEYMVVAGPGFNSTVPASSILTISFRVQPGDVNFYIEGRNVSITYKLQTQNVVNMPRFRYVPLITFNSGWLVRESHSNTSCLNINHTVLEGDWLYRLRFENIDPQTDKIVDLSVIEYWTEIDLREAITPYYLLSFEFAYVGAAVVASGIVVSTLGMTTKKFRGSDVWNFAKRVFDDIRSHMETKEIVIVLVLTLALLFLSIFMRTRVGIGEILVGQETKKTFVLYRGLPLEMIGIVAPLKLEDADLIFGPLMVVSSIGHGSATLDRLVSYNDPVGGTFLMFPDGILFNSIFYFVSSFFLVLTFNCLKKKLSGEI